MNVSFCKSQWFLRERDVRVVPSLRGTRPGSVLKRDDGVDFVDVVRTVPKNPGEVVRVRRVVHFDFAAESPVFGERVHLSFVIDHMSIGDVQQVFDPTSPV